MNYQDYLTIEPGKRSGKPCIRGMRITVYDVLGYLASGMTDEELLADFSGRTREGTDACRAFAADTERRVGEIGAKATSRNDRAALASAQKHGTHRCPPA